MAVKQATKRIYYFRSVSNDKQPVDIQKKTKAALSVLPHIADTEVNFADEVIRIQRRADQDKRDYLHIVNYAPGEKSSTLTPSIRKTDDNEVGHAPPAGKEYKKGEAFIVIKNSDILFCSNGLTYQKVELYLHRLFQDTNVSTERFKLKPASNLDKIKLLRAQGVKSVRLNISAFKLSLPAKKKASWLGRTLAPIAAEFTALAGKDRSRSEEKALEDMIVSIEVGLDGNSRATNDAKDTVTDLAAEVLDNELDNIDSFVIMTRDNTPITSESIKLHTDFKVSKSDTSIDFGETWRAMEAYFNRLTTDNLLEQ